MTGSPAGLGWDRLAQAVAVLVPVGEVDGVWLFTPIRHDAREWGTAVVSRVDGERRRIYTARYVFAIKGKERGRFETSIEEVGSGPVDALASLLQEAHRRIDDEHPPAPVPPSDWFASVPPSGDGAPAPSTATPADAASQ